MGSRSSDSLARAACTISSVDSSSPKLLVELSPTGQVLHSWETYVTEAGLSTSPDGSVLVADYGAFAVDRLTDNQFTAIVTFKLNSLAGVTGVFRPSGVAVDRPRAPTSSSVAIPTILLLPMHLS